MTHPGGEEEETEEDQINDMSVHCIGSGSLTLLLSACQSALLDPKGHRSQAKRHCHCSRSLLEE